MNVSGGDFRLIEASPFLEAGTDGADLGADVALLKLAYEAAAGTPPTAGRAPAQVQGLRQVTGGLP